MKRKLTILVSGVILLAWIAVLILCGRPCKKYEYSGDHTFETGAAVQEVLFEGISLAPGHYRIELSYQTDTDTSAYVTAGDSTVITGGLWTNFERTYSHLDKTDLEIWLFEQADDLRISAQYLGVGSFETGKLVIRQTCQLWTMLMTILTFGWILILVAAHLVELNRNHLLSRERKQVIFWLAVISLLSSIPFMTGFSIAGGDLLYHLERIEGLKDGLLGGQFPVRIEPKWLYDHGYASGVFYCNLFLLFPACLRLLGFPITLSYSLYCIAVNIVTAYLAYYCFEGIFRDHRTGIVCSALYTLSLNRIHKLCNIAVVGECAAIAFLPLIFYGLYRIFAKEAEKDRKGWIPLTIGLTGILQSHVLTCEITAFLILFFCLVYLKKVWKPGTFFALLKAAVFPVLGSLWFLVPFMDYYLTQDMHVKHVSARTIQKFGLRLTDLLMNFVKVGKNLQADGNIHVHVCYVGAVLILPLLVFLGLWCFGRFRERDEQLKIIKLTALAGLALLFMSLDVFPWDRIQALHPVAAALVSSLQFPNRLLDWAVLCLVAVFGYLLVYFRERELKLYGAFLLAAALGILTSGMYLVDHSTCSNDTYTLYHPGGMGYGYISGAEYLIEGTDASKLTYGLPEAGEGVSLTGYVKKSLGAEADLVNRGQTESYLELPLLLYKGYRAVDADTGEGLAIISGENGKVRVVLPAGYQGHVRVRFESPVYWRIAEAVSLVTWIGFGVAAAAERRKRKQISGEKDGL